MMIPTFLFMATHVAGGVMLALALPAKYHIPLIILSVFSCILEHNPNGLYEVGMAILGPLNVAAMIMHYYFAYSIIDKQTVRIGIAANVALIIFAGGTDFG